MKLNIGSRETISKGFLNVDRIEIILPNGKRIFREVLQKPNGIAILPISSTGEVYLTKQPRAGVGFLESIEIPAGLINEDELPEVSAERELSEETGCILTNPLIPLGKFVPDPSCCTNITYLFLALNVKKVGELHLDRDECLECFTTTIEKVYSMLENGEIIDANSIITLERAKKYLLN